MRKDNGRLFNNIIGTAYIVLAALLWGSSFAVRKIGMESIGPLMMNAIRFFIAFIFMFIVLLLRMYFSPETRPERSEMKRQIRTGVIVGTPYAFTVVFQQIGLNTVSAGETGFITALYSVMVPILGWIVFKTKIRPINWVAVVLSGIGLYFVTNGGISFNFGMVILFFGSICTAIQILLVGKFIDDNDPLILVTIQIAVGTVINLIVAVIMREDFSFYMVRESIWPIVYSGLFSIGIADFCQFLGQKRVSPTVAGIACSFESVFGLLFGILLLGESVTFTKICGCILILITVIMVQCEPRQNVSGEEKK